MKSIHGKEKGRKFARRSLNHSSVRVSPLWAAGTLIIVVRVTETSHLLTGSSWFYTDSYRKGALGKLSSKCCPRFRDFNKGKIVLEHDFPNCAWYLCVLSHSSHYITSHESIVLPPLRKKRTIPYSAPVFSEFNSCCRSTLICGDRESPATLSVVANISIGGPFSVVWPQVQRNPHFLHPEYLLRSSSAEHPVGGLEFLTRWQIPILQTFD